MKKDTILHTITKLLVRNGRTAMRSAAYSSALTSALRVFVVLFLLMVVGSSGVEAVTITYHIINLGRLDDNGQLTSTRTEALKFTSTTETVGLPSNYKSPLAKNWKYYSASDVSFNSTTKVCTFNSGPSLSEGETLSANAHVYVTYEFDDDKLSTVGLFDGGVCKIKFNNTNQYLQQTVYDSQPNTGSFTLQENSTFYWKINVKDPYQITIQSQSTDYPNYFLSADKGLYGDIRLKTPLGPIETDGTAKNNKVWAFGLLPVGSTNTYRLIVTDGYTYNANKNGIDQFGHGYLNNNDIRSGVRKTRYQKYLDGDYLNCDLKFEPLTKRYNIVNNSGITLVQASTEEYALKVPNVIKSPLATYSYYSDAEGTNELSAVGSTTTIYVRYTTNDVLDLSGGTPYNIKVNGNYLYDNSSALALESSEDNIGNSSYTWTLNGNDAYQITIQNVANTSNNITYDVSSGEAVPTLGGGSKFFLHAGIDGKYEIVATTTADFTTSGYYTLGVANSTLKLYSKSNYPMGENEVQAIIQRPTASLSGAPTANSLTYNKTEQELVSADGIVVKNGTLQYRIGDSGDYSDIIPKATDANTYSVYYKVKGNTGIEDFIAADPIEVTINKQSITVDGITASNKVYDGTADASLVYTDATLAGNLDGENLTVSATGTFENVNVGTGKNVSISELTLGGSAVGNYVLAESGQQETTTANITAAEITVSGITAEDKPYDGNTTATLVYSNATLTGKVGEDNLTVSATGTFDNASVGTGKTVTISDLTLGGTAAGNYTLAEFGQQGTATAAITVAEITVSGITASDKVYDGGVFATLVYSSATLSGKVGSEDLSITATGTFDNKNVGTGKTVTISDLTLGGNDAGNYVLAESGQQATATAAITAAEITVSGITANDKPYDGTTTATLVYTSVTLSGNLDGENLTVTATGVFADANVGTDKTVTITGLTLEGAAAGNYALAESGQQETATAAISAAEITVNGIEAEDKVYDGGTSATLDYSNVTLSGKVGSEDLSITATGTFDNKNVGTGKTVTISDLTLGGNDVGNYVLAVSGQQASTIAGITAKEITVSGIKADNKVYDGTITATFVCSEAAFTGKVDEDNLTVSATGTFADANVGTDKTVTITGLTLDGSAAGNYALAASGQQIEAIADITKAALSVTANDNSIAYGEAPADAGVTYDGFVNGETESVLGGTLAFSYNSAANGLGTPYASTSSPGSYFIIPSGLTSTNYNISFVAGVLTVGKKSIGSGTTPNTGISFSLENGNIIVKDGETELTKDADYTLGTPTTSGRYTTTEVTGIGNYASTLTITFANVNLMNDGKQGTEWSATFVADGDHALPTAEGITPYIVENINLSNNTVSLTALDYIPNGVPVLLLSSSDVDGFLVKAPTPTSYTEISSEQIAANRLKVATGSESFALRQIYLLYNNEFVLNMPGSLDAGRVYMLNPSFPYSSPARLRISRAPSTGISEINRDDNTETLDDRWYNLDGLRLNGKPTKKGLYLKEGKKVVIK